MPWNTTFLADHAPALDDSGDSFLNSILLSEYDFTNPLGTGLFDLDSMATMSAVTMGGHFSGDALFNWDQTNASLLSTPMISTASETRTTSSPVHMISPVSSQSSTNNSDTLSYSFTNANQSSKSSSSKKRPASDSNDINTTTSTAPRLEENDQVNKRQRNTEAARRYRQRKLDRVSELEEALAEMTRERDDLKLQLARSQAEADVLRGMVRKT